MYNSLTIELRYTPEQLKIVAAEILKKSHELDILKNYAAAATDTFIMHLVNTKVKNVYKNKAEELIKKGYIRLARFVENQSYSIKLYSLNVTKQEEVKDPLGSDRIARVTTEMHSSIRDFSNLVEDTYESLEYYFNLDENINQEPEYQEEIINIVDLFSRAEDIILEETNKAVELLANRLELGYLDYSVSIS